MIEAGRVVRLLARTSDLGLSIQIFQLIYFSPLKFTGLRTRKQVEEFLGACDRAHSKFCPSHNAAYNISLMKFYKKKMHTLGH